MKKVVVITGAGGGIGRATVDVFAAAGWEAIGIDRRDASDITSAVSFHRFDASEPLDIAYFFEWMRGHYERLDALINNAAIQICKPLVEMTVVEWDAIMASNLRSMFLMTRAAYPLLKSARGAIVNVGSVHAVATSKEIAAYATSKGGAVALTRAMALEFGDDGVRANSILPGAVDTAMLRDGLKRGAESGVSVSDRMEELARKTVLGRVGHPDEIAKAILFLADNDQSSYMTGQSLIIDGGATSRLSTE
jgi:NAD(P)-dependent dehydrogenase (short-subunit alcohol dehydrogenase family)